MDKVDYLIVGQGVAGSLLAHELRQSGASVFVWNHETENTSSNKAAGMYNPITGRKMVKSWLADEIFPGLESYYRGLEKAYQAEVIFPKPVYRPFFSVEEQNDWEGKSAEENFTGFIKQLCPETIKVDGIVDPFGGLLLNYSGYVDLPVLIRAVRKSLDNRGMYGTGMFHYDQMKVHPDFISYKNVKAKRIIFCEGPEAVSNPYWRHLPFRPVRGEIMEIEATLPEDMIVSRGVFIVPKKGYFQVGSTYDHSNLSYTPDPEGIKTIRNRLSKIFNGKYRIIGALAGVRPATYDRKPFIGSHPQEEKVMIFNGFGTKGVSLVPYFARQLVNYLQNEKNLPPQADISRIKQSSQQ